MIGVLRSFGGLVVCLSFVTTATAHEARLEGGGARVLSNVIQVPNDQQGTRLDLSTGPVEAFARVQLTFDLDENQSIRVLYAPFQTKRKILAASPIAFQGKTFAAGSETLVDYKFNSYRASYLYTWNPKSPFRPHAGFTAKVRDAHIKLNNGTEAASRANVGFVPLLNVGFDWSMGSDLVLIFDLDGLAAKQGRAFDGKIELAYAMDQGRWLAGLGYRVLEGGVDSEENYNFTLVEFGFASLAFRF